MKLSSPILAFTLASTAIHTSLILMSDSVDLILPGSSGSVMSVKLQEEKIKTTNPAQIEKTQTREVKKARSQNKLLKPDKKIAAKENQSQTAVTKKKNSISKAHVVSIIYKQLNNHFTYPKIAQKRNWQGQVIISFRLNRDGNIQNIKIMHSSGYGILDQAAVASLKKVGQLPQITTLLNSGMEIQMPIIYQLTKS